MPIFIKPVQVQWQHNLEGQRMDWGIKARKVYEVWKVTMGEGVNVAILDTGIADHDDLRENVKRGINFTSSDAGNFKDGIGHGTHVAGIVAAADNKIGVVGVAPKANIHVVKVLGDDGSGSFEMVANGIDWAIKNKMDIISMSLGSNYDSPVIHNAIKEAYRNNITIVAAAGNDGDEYDDNDIDYPAKYPEAIAVGAVNEYLKRSWFSSDGEELAVAAPGEEINSTYLDNSYAILSGTSMATPFVTGVLALLISKHRTTEDNKTPIDTPARIREHLLRLVDDAGDIGKDRFYGYGIVAPAKMMEGINMASLY